MLFTVFIRDKYRNSSTRHTNTYAPCQRIIDRNTDYIEDDAILPWKELDGSTTCEKDSNEHFLVGGGAEPM